MGKSEINFRKNAHLNPKEIVERLNSEADSLTGDKPIDGDIILQLCNFDSIPN